MAKRKVERDYSRMSGREREIFNILAGRSGVTLTKILEKMDDPPTRQAVRALLTIMERKGFVCHEKSGREYVFFPTGSGKGASRKLFRDLLQKVFGGSLKDALASHLDDDEVGYSDEELREIEKLFKQQQPRKQSK